MRFSLPIVIAVLAAGTAAAAVYVSRSGPDNAASRNSSAIAAPGGLAAARSSGSPATGNLDRHNTGKVAAFVYKQAPEPVPDFQFFDAGQQTRTIEAFKGKVVLLNLWATYWRDRDGRNQKTRGIVIASNGAHSSIKAMAKVIDTDVLLIETESRLESSHLADTLSRMSAGDRARVFAVIATAGTTNAGIIDDLAGIVAICKSEGIWFHVDDAYGGGALAARSVRHLFNGIEHSDSVTIDPHKWLFSPYDCGAIIYRDSESRNRPTLRKGPTSISSGTKVHRDLIRRIIRYS